MEIELFTLWKNIKDGISEEVEISPLKRVGNKFKGTIQYTKTDLRNKDKKNRFIEEFILRDVVFNLNNVKPDRRVK